MADPKKPNAARDGSLRGALSSLQLGHLKPAAAQPRSNAVPAPPAMAGANTSTARISVRVEDASRAGVAPYNFVPLPNEARYLKPEEAPPSHAAYHADLLTGEIEVRLEALTDFYIRGMSTLEEYSAHRGEGKAETTKPFQTNAAAIARVEPAGHDPAND